VAKVFDEITDHIRAWVARQPRNARSLDGLPAVG